jgi:hypothetical protein
MMVRAPEQVRASMCACSYSQPGTLRRVWPRHFSTERDLGKPLRIEDFQKGWLVVPHGSSCRVMWQPIQHRGKEATERLETSRVARSERIGKSRGRQRRITLAADTCRENQWRQSPGLARPACMGLVRVPPLWSRNQGPVNLSCFGQLAGSTESLFLPGHSLEAGMSSWSYLKGWGEQL